MTISLDNKIIEVLRRDGRYSYAKLAKELDVNVATVTRHVEKLLEQNRISIETVLNPFKLGFHTHALIALNVDLTRVRQICSQLIVNFNISLLVTTFGRYDILVIADFSSFDMLQKFITKDLPKIEGVDHIDAFPIVEIKKIYSALFKANLNNNKIDLDQTDLVIIDELSKNGRISYTELGQKLNINLTTVSRRVDRLIKDEVMRVSALRDPSKWGYVAHAYLAVHADLKKVDAICAKLAANQEVNLVVTLMSGFEILIGISFPSPEIMNAYILDKIAPIDGINKIETYFCSGIRKRRWGLIDPEKVW